MGHQLHRGVELVLKISDLVLFPFPLVADQRHGAHAGEPVEVLVLERRPRRGEEEGRDLVGFNRDPAYVRGLKEFLGLVLAAALQFPLLASSCSLLRSS